VSAYSPDLRAFIELHDPTSIGLYLVEFDRLVERTEAMREACVRIAELTDGPAYPPALGHAIRLAQRALS